MDVFSTLPTEILRTIADSLLPDTLFSLGLTCKRVYQYLHDLVKAQRELAEKYSSVDTRHPLSAVTALRKILTDPIAAWHLRSINIWRMPWEIAAWDDRAGQDDINFLSYALEYPHIWNSSACKKIYKRMRERWRDFTYLQYGVDASGRAIRGAEVSQELADQHGYLTGHRNPCQEAFISNEEVKVFEALLEPFIANLANHHVNAGFGCRAIFLLVACAPRLRHVWHARPDESWAPWHTYLGKFFRKLGGSTTEQQGLHSSQDSLAPLSALRLRLPPGFFALRLTAERRISLHLWSGSPDPEVRICAHLCGRFVPTEKKHFRWPDGPRSWNFYSNYNWVTGRDELQYGSRYPYNLPQTNDEREMPIQFLHEWNENFFKDRIKELYTNPNEVHELVDLNLVENSLDSLDSSKFDMLVDNLCKRYKVEEDKARRVKESMELGRKVVDQLGGEGGRLVCKDFKWQRVYD
ncbi:hypothetical protein H2198_001639 [Neophaeococcomyces mojaviensis]|uniref:Uncharacterized protein n=1 Tax=Neophaeococcomyces mojaviensis TaxID=3383035 RepID=A0ACC3AG68_9EURO|nr:hypothetical protein H2198_001639 [Knufia sp. JES_112]